MVRIKIIEISIIVKIGNGSSRGGVG